MGSRVNARKRAKLLTAAAAVLALVIAGPAYGQVQEPPPEEATSPAGGTVEQPVADPAAAPAEEYDDEGEAIVVTGVRRGTVI